MVQSTQFITAMQINAWCMAVRHTRNPLLPFPSDLQLWLPHAPLHHQAVCIQLDGAVRAVARLRLDGRRERDVLDARRVDGGAPRVVVSAEVGDDDSGMTVQRRQHGVVVPAQTGRVTAGGVHGHVTYDTIGRVTSQLAANTAVNSCWSH